MQAVLKAARNGCARTNNAQRVGGGSTLRRCAALYSERLRSLRVRFNIAHIMRASAKRPA